MAKAPPRSGSEKAAALHPRNRHRGRYDFPLLVRHTPALQNFLRPSPRGETTIDFANPAAVLALNRALLAACYGVTHWEVPHGYLVPPIPGRADYIHHVADLLASERGGSPPRGESLALLDIGVGASCIYPMLGVAEYGWRFVGTDIDASALAVAQRIVSGNAFLAGRVELRRQADPQRILVGVVRAGEVFDAVVCNPPFHASAADALAGTRRKLRNLSGRTIARDKTVLNFGGHGAELWTPGGEREFVRRMIAESAQLPTAARWFTTLVSKAENLPALQAALANVSPREVRILAMGQGQKKSRVLAWTFGPPG